MRVWLNNNLSLKYLCGKSPLLHRSAEVSPLEHVFKSANIRTNSSRYRRREREGLGERGERVCVCVRACVWGRESMIYVESWNQPQVWVSEALATMATFEGSNRGAGPIWRHWLNGPLYINSTKETNSIWHELDRCLAQNDKYDKKLMSKYFVPVASITLIMQGN